MNESFEGTFGVQEQFPIGNRDRDIDEAIEMLKGKFFGTKFTKENAEKLEAEVFDIIAQKYEVYPDILFGHASDEKGKKEEERVGDFMSVYGEKEILNRLEPHLRD